MSIQNEYERLENMVTDFTLTSEQRQAASDALDEIDNKSILDSWKNIENSGEQLTALTQRLSNVISDIQNNISVLDSMDELSEIINGVVDIVESSE